MKQEFDAAYWQQRYETNETGWDNGSITTPLKDYFDQLNNKELRILIPGCGNAYEAEYLVEHGFEEVYLVDSAQAPLLNFKKRVPSFPESHLICKDFFTLEGQFNLIVEQTFFCALLPELRPAYARKCAELLVPGGKLIGLLFDTAFDKVGPPFGGNREEYVTYFAPYFDFLYFETAYNSIAPRQEKELFILLQKK